MSIDSTETSDLLPILQKRFAKYKNRHLGIEWSDVQKKLLKSPEKFQILQNMENTGGEPDVIGKPNSKGEFLFVDCSAETPMGRRGLCYDREAFDARKENKPEGNVVDDVKKIGSTLLDETLYRYLQDFGPFDQKTSSWIETPAPERKLGGALFGDYRYGRAFIYHNGAQSYYSARAYRTYLWV